MNVFDRHLTSPSHDNHAAAREDPAASLILDALLLVDAARHNDLSVDLGGLALDLLERIQNIDVIDLTDGSSDPLVLENLHR